MNRATLWAIGMLAVVSVAVGSYVVGQPKPTAEQRVKTEKSGSGCCPAHPAKPAAPVITPVAAEATEACCPTKDSAGNAAAGATKEGCGEGQACPMQAKEGCCEEKNAAKPANAPLPPAAGGCCPSQSPGELKAADAQ